MRSDKMGRKGMGWVVLACALLGTAYVLQTGMAAQDGKGAAVIRGTVRSSDGTSLHGILVSAREAGKNSATYVFTDDKGSYDFPPLPLGSYQVSVGTAWRETVPLTASGATRDFAVQLGPGFLNQVTGASLLKAIPGSEAEKARIAQDCVGCHSTARLFSRAPASPGGWAAIVKNMLEERLPKSDWYPKGPENPLYTHYRARFTPENVKAITEFLAKNITPETQNVYAARAIVRPTGEAARVVFTEWDLPQETGGVTGALTDPEGVIWYTATGTNSLGRLDPRTGENQVWKISGLKQPGERGARLHDMDIDERRDVWITAAGVDQIVKFDVRSERFTLWNTPATGVGTYPHTAGFDKARNYWITVMDGSDSGVVKLDPRTGAFAKFPALTKWSYSYGLAVDQSDNVWFTQHHANKIGKVDTAGKLTDYTVPRPVALPRRLRADSRGSIWFTQSGFPAAIGMLDPLTGKFSEYQYGVLGGYPYFIRVDKFDKVWFNSVEGNMIGKFDPETKKFVLFLLPLPDSYSRNGFLDYSSNPLALIYPMASSSGRPRPAIGRMYIRP